MEDNQVFYEKVHVKTKSKKKDVLVIFMLWETKNFNLFDKTQENAKCHIQHEESWLKICFIYLFNTLFTVE